MMLQTTSLASVVTIMDITGVARNLYSEYYLPFGPFLQLRSLFDLYFLH